MDTAKKIVETKRLFEELQMIMGDIEVSESLIKSHEQTILRSKERILEIYEILGISSLNQVNKKLATIEELNQVKSELQDEIVMMDSILHMSGFYYDNIESHYKTLPNSKLHELHAQIESEKYKVNLKLEEIELLESLIANLEKQQKVNKRVSVPLYNQHSLIKPKILKTEKIPSFLPDQHFVSSLKQRLDIVNKELLKLGFTYNKEQNDYKLNEDSEINKMIKFYNSQIEKKKPELDNGTKLHTQLKQIKAIKKGIKRLKNIKQKNQIKTIEKENKELEIFKNIEAEINGITEKSKAPTHN